MKQLKQLKMRISNIINQKSNTKKLKIEYNFKYTNYLRKISRKNNDKQGVVLWNIFGKKYSSLINIKFELTSKGKTINLNGQILTQKGLEKLIANTKKKNIY